jgi:hypothetical protein
MEENEDSVLWGKILNVLRKKYASVQPEIIEVIPDQPLRFQIKDADGKFSYYSVTFNVSNSGEVIIDWTTVELTDPF